MVPVAGRGPEAWNPDQYNNPDNVSAYRELAWRCTPNWAASTCWCARWAPAATSRVARVLREFNPEMTLIGVDTVGSTILATGPAPPDARPGLKHLSGQRGLRGVQRSPLGGTGRVRVGVPGVGGHPLRDGRVGVGAVALVAGWAARNRPAAATVAAIFPDGRNGTSRPSSTTTTAASTICSMSPLPPSR